MSTRKLTKSSPGSSLEIRVQRIRAALPRIGFGVLVLLTALFLASAGWKLPEGRGAVLGHLIGLLSLALAPGLAIGLYIYYQDRLYDESMQLLGRIFGYGLLTASAAGVAELVVEAVAGYADETATIAGRMLFYFGVVGLSEEFVKFAVVWRLTYHAPVFKQVYDGVLFCAASALGFASIENVLYVMTSGEDALAVAVGRAITAVPSHLSFGIVMGYGMGRARAVKGTSKEREWLVLGFAGAVALHGAYDFFLTFQSAVVLMFLVVMVGGWWLAYRSLKRSLSFSPFARCARCNRTVPQLADFCPYCRAERTIELACNACGKPIGKWSRRCTSCNARIRLPWHLRPGRAHDLYPDREPTECGMCGEKVPGGFDFCLHCGRRLALPEKVISD